MDALLRRARDVRFISSTVKNENKTEGEQKKTEAKIGEGKEEWRETSTIRRSELILEEKRSQKGQ